MGVESVIDSWIARGGEGAYPSLQVTRRTSTIVGGKLSEYPRRYFYVAASVRPSEGAQLVDETEGRHTTERRKVYTNTAELWPATGATPASEAHEADVVTLYPIAASLALSSFCSAVDAIISSTVVGKDGNDVTLELVADGVMAGDLDEDAWPAIVFHFEPNVTTDVDLELAIAASTTLSILTTGTAASVFVAGDANGAHAFAGGDGEEWRVVGCSRYRRFWKAMIERLTRP